MSDSVRRFEWYPMGWGGELWVIKNENYWGRLMFLEPGKRGSIHYHTDQMETFMVLVGQMKLDLYPQVPRMDDPSCYTPQRRQSSIPRICEVINIPPRIPHQFVGIERTLLIEISTQRFESDTHRVVVGDVLKGGDKDSVHKVLVDIAQILPW